MLWEARPPSATAYAPVNELNPDVRCDGRACARPLQGASTGANRGELAGRRSLPRLGGAGQGGVAFAAPRCYIFPQGAQAGDAKIWEG